MARHGATFFEARNSSRELRGRYAQKGKPQRYTRKKRPLLGGFFFRYARFTRYACATLHHQGSLLVLGADIFLTNTILDGIT
jgi:hypothetical protein